MSNIQENLQKILSAVWGKDVRQAIHDAIHDCYEDGSAGSVDLIAREGIEDLEENSATKTELQNEATARSNGDQNVLDELNDYKDEVSQITTVEPTRTQADITIVDAETILRKNGKFVEAKLRFTLNNHITSPTTLFTFPDGYKPLAVCRIITHDWNLQSAVRFNLHPNGEFQTVDSIAMNYSFILSFVYMVE